MVAKMADKSADLRLANPTPEIRRPTPRPCARLHHRDRPFGLPEPGQQRPASPFIFRGALDVGATTINEMKLACVKAIAELAPRPRPATSSPAPISGQGAQLRLRIHHSHALRSAPDRQDRARGGEGGDGFGGGDQCRSTSTPTSPASTPSSPVRHRHEAGVLGCQGGADGAEARDLRRRRRRKACCTRCGGARLRGLATDPDQPVPAVIEMRIKKIGLNLVPGRDFRDRQPGCPRYRGLDRSTTLMNRGGRTGQRSGAVPTPR